MKRLNYFLFLFLYVHLLSAQLEKLATGFLQPEGPVWKDGLGLLFSDIKANKIYRWSPNDSLSVFLFPSDSSNGLTFALEGNLVLTQMAKRRVSRRESDGSITLIATTYNGKKFNSPNDLVVKSDGAIFFTDPDFNTPVGQQKEMGFKGIFRVNKYGFIHVLDSTTFEKPNGICFSPDESKLYVNESPKRIIYVWDILNDSILTNKRKLFTIPGRDYVDYADGMKVDLAGNIYSTGPRGVWIISADGNLLDSILIPEVPSNCAWGDEDRKTLYIIAGLSLYRVRVQNSSYKSSGQLNIKMFRLCSNYPNPCNSTTNIDYYLSERAPAKLELYDASGRYVASISNEIKDAGYNTVRFSLLNLASGIYFYRLD